MDWSENQPGAAESFTPLWLKTKKISTCITSERTSVHNPENNEYVMDHYPSWAALSVRRLLKEGSCLPRNRALHPQICSLLLKMLAAKIVLPSLETSGAKKIFKLFFFPFLWSQWKGNVTLGMWGRRGRHSPSSPSVLTAAVITVMRDPRLGWTDL